MRDCQLITFRVVWRSGRPETTIRAVRYYIDPCDPDLAHIDPEEYADGRQRYRFVGLDGNDCAVIFFDDVLTVIAEQDAVGKIPPGFVGCAAGEG